LLVDAEELNKIWILRKVLSSMSSTESMEFLIEKMRSTKNNRAFFKAMQG